MITIQMRVVVSRKILIWAAAYMLNNGMAHPYLMKRDMMEFLRRQIGQFGTDEFTLMGHNWQIDLAEEIPEATAWVDKRFA